MSRRHHLKRKVLKQWSFCALKVRPTSTYLHALYRWRERVPQVWKTLKGELSDPANWRALIEKKLSGRCDWVSCGSHPTCELFPLAGANSLRLRNRWSPEEFGSVRWEVRSTFAAGLGSSSSALRSLWESKTHTMLKLFKSGFYLGISLTIGDLDLPFCLFKRFLHIFGSTNTNRSNSWHLCSFIFCFFVNYHCYLRSDS